jgi:hypothetical protein
MRSNQQTNWFRITKTCFDLMIEMSFSDDVVEGPVQGAWG